MNTQSIINKRHFRLLPAFSAGFLLGLALSVLILTLKASNW